MSFEEFLHSNSMAPYTAVVQHIRGQIAATRDLANPKFALQNIRAPLFFDGVSGVVSVLSKLLKAVRDHCVQKRRSSPRNLTQKLSDIFADVEQRGESQFSIGRADDWAEDNPDNLDVILCDLYKLINYLEKTQAEYQDDIDVTDEGRFLYRILANFHLAANRIAHAQRATEQQATPVQYPQVVHKQGEDSRENDDFLYPFVEIFRMEVSAKDPFGSRVAITDFRHLTTYDCVTVATALAPLLESISCCNVAHLTKRITLGGGKSTLTDVINNAVDIPNSDDFIIDLLLLENFMIRVESASPKDSPLKGRVILLGLILDLYIFGETQQGKREQGPPQLHRLKLSQEVSNFMYQNTTNPAAHWRAPEQLRTTPSPYGSHHTYESVGENGSYPVHRASLFPAARPLSALSDRHTQAAQSRPASQLAQHQHNARYSPHSHNPVVDFPESRSSVSGGKNLQIMPFSTGANHRTMVHYGHQSRERPYNTQPLDEEHLYSYHPGVRSLHTSGRTRDFGPREPRLTLPLYKDAVGAREFMQEFEDMCETFNTPDNRKIKFLEQCVKGSDGESWVRRYIFLHGRNCDWAALSAAFVEGFTGDAAKQQAKQKMKLRTLLPTENVHRYINDKLDLITRYDPDMPVDKQIDKIIAGLPQSYASWVPGHKFNTIDEFSAFIIKIDADLNRFKLAPGNEKPKVTIDETPILVTHTKAQSMQHVTKDELETCVMSTLVNALKQFGFSDRRSRSQSRSRENSSRRREPTPFNRESRSRSRDRSYDHSRRTDSMSNQYSSSNSNSRQSRSRDRSSSRGQGSTYDNNRRSSQNRFSRSRSRSQGRQGSQDRKYASNDNKGSKNGKE